MSINSKRKGDRWESEVHNHLAAIYGDANVMEGVQAKTGHKFVDRLTPELAVECKVGARINLMAALDQCERDAAPRELNVGRYCVVYAKFDRRPPVVLMRAADFEDLVKTRRELMAR